MQCFISSNRDIYFNLALEEYLLMHKSEDFFFLWQSEPAVVVGKHQNALAEINYRFLRENGIRIARRLSGGGTVYHDEGNINFTYVANGEPGKLVDFKKYIEPVVTFLELMGIEAVQGPKNEILTRQKKFSGNAEHVFKNRVLHHGTLLFHSNLARLRESLKVIPDRYRDKAVQSNRSSVINISDCLSDPMEIGTFERRFLDFMLSRSQGKLIEPDERDLKAVSGMAGTKFKSWEWIFGWSPDYELTSTFNFQNIECRIYIKVSRGILNECTIESGQVPREDLARLTGLLRNGRHDADQIRTAILKWNHPSVRNENAVEEMVYSFF